MKTLSIEERKNLTPDKALEVLIKGNERFTNNLLSIKDHLEVLSQFSDEQKPFAFILSCIDSRAPVEIIFDQGIGDLFSARVAGNIVNEDIIASAEFAVKMVGVKLIMILGHSNCGAMTACLNNIQEGHLKYLVNKIRPTYLKYKETIDQHSQPNNQLAEYNVRETARQLIEKSEIIREYLNEGKIKIATAFYSLDSGRVEVLEVIGQVRN